MPKSSRYFDNEKALQHYAAQLARANQTPSIIFLSGILGAGKTTFVRGFLRELGFTESVKSPSFSLVEEYHLQNQWIYHFDFYRIQNPQELTGFGFRDYLSLGTLLIEWPEHVLSLLPKPDLHFHFEIVGEGRNVVIDSASGLGEEILEKLSS